MKKFRKLLAAVLAGIMVIGAMSVAAFADEEVTFTSVTYNFECTTFVGADTLTLKATTLAWANPETTKDVTAAGAFTVELTMDAATGFNNIGFFESANSVANIYKLNSITINGVDFVFQADSTVEDGKDAIYQTSTIDATDSQMNGFPNIWNGAGKQAVVAKSANGSTINGSANGMTITWAASDIASGDTSSTALVFVAVAALAVVATVSVKKYAVER